jgi:hypothetical protein
MRKPWLFLLSLFALGFRFFFRVPFDGFFSAIGPTENALLQPFESVGRSERRALFLLGRWGTNGDYLRYRRFARQGKPQTIEMLPVATYADYQAHLKAKDFDLLLNASDLLLPFSAFGYDLTDSYLSVSYSKATLRNNTKSPTTIACLGDNSMAGVYARYFYYANQITVYETMDELPRGGQKRRMLRRHHQLDLCPKTSKRGYSKRLFFHQTLRLFAQTQNRRQTRRRWRPFKSSITAIASPRAKISSTPSSPAIPIS